MAELYTFKTVFEPVLLPKEQARLITSSNRIDIEVIAVGALPQYTKDFGALSAASWDTDNEDTNLEMADFEMSQLRMRVDDNMKVRLNNLSSTRQWRTSKGTFFLPQFPTDAGEDFLKEYLFKASEFFVFEKDTPRFDLYSDVALLTSRITFSGWRYRVRKMMGANPQKVIWVSGWPSGTEGLT